MVCGLGRLAKERLDNQHAVIRERSHRRTISNALLFVVACSDWCANVAPVSGTHFLRLLRLTLPKLRMREKDRNILKLSADRCSAYHRLVAFVPYARLH